MKRYWNALKDQSLLRQLSFIQLITYFGAWFSNVAIYTLLIQMGASASTIAFVAALHFIAGVVQAPLSGVIIDRVHPKKLMLVLAFIEIVCTLGLLLIQSNKDMGLLYLLVFIRMGAASFQFTVEMALLPRILEPKILQIANEIHSIIWSLSYTFGMALSGFVVYMVGIPSAFLLDAFLFFIALFFIFRLPLDIVMHNERVDRFMTMMKDAVVYLQKNTVLVHLMILHALIGFTAFDALVALAAKEFYAQWFAVSLGIGLVHAARALGLSIGPVFLGEWVNNQRLQWLFLAEAMSIGLWALVIDNFYISLIASVFVGFVTTTLWSYTYTLLQRHTQSEYYGRIIAYNDMLFLAVGAFASWLIGFLSHYISLTGVGLTLSFVFLIGTFYYIWLQGRYILKEIE